MIDYHQFKCVVDEKDRVVYEISSLISKRSPSRLSFSPRKNRQPSGIGINSATTYDQYHE
jgi:hypothetical protein